MRGTILITAVALCALWTAGCKPTGGPKTAAAHASPAGGPVAAPVAPPAPASPTTVASAASEDVTQPSDGSDPSPALGRSCFAFEAGRNPQGPEGHDGPFSVLTTGEALKAIPGNTVRWQQQGRAETIIVDHDDALSGRRSEFRVQFVVEASPPATSRNCGPEWGVVQGASLNGVVANTPNNVLTRNVVAEGRALQERKDE